MSEMAHHLIQFPDGEGVKKWWEAYFLLSGCDLGVAHIISVHIPLARALSYNQA